MDEMAKKLNNFFSFVSCIYGTVTRGVWFVDSVASFHMKGPQDVFTNINREPREIHIY